VKVKEIGMDKSTKAFLLGIGALLLVCACTSATILATGLWSFDRITNWAVENVSESPDVAVRAGSEIAEFDIPDGFGSPYSIHFGEVTMVGYQSQNEKNHILLAQFPEGTSIRVEELLEDIREFSSDPQGVWYTTEMTVIEQKTVTIRGEETTLDISEGTSSDGIAYRLATAGFAGRGGPSLVLIAGPLDEWDIEMVEAFIASIR
jgi:hypothetical protein